MLNAHGEVFGLVAAHLHQAAGVGCDQDGGVGGFGLAQFFGGHCLRDFVHAGSEQTAKTAAAFGFFHFDDLAAHLLKQGTGLVFKAKDTQHVAGVVVADLQWPGSFFSVQRHAGGKKFAEFKDLAG